MIAAEAMRLVDRPARHVAMTRLRSEKPALDGLELMLKGGQMGPVDLFERLLDR